MKFFIGSILALTLVILSACSKKSADEHLKAAEGLVENGQISAAVLELKNAVQLSPTSGQARFMLGQIYLQQGDYESAEKELNKALENGYAASEVIPLLSEAYQKTGAANALSELDYQQQGMTASEQVKAGFYKLLALAQLNDDEEARLLIDELSVLDTQSVYKGLVRAYSSVLDEDYAAAVVSVRALREQSPLNEDVLRLLIKLELNEQNKEAALELFEALLRVSPKDNETRFTYLALLMDLQEFDKADPIIDQLLALSAENGLLNQFKGTVLAQKNDFANALAYLEKALLAGRDNNIIRLLAGYSAYRTENYAESVKHLSFIAEQLPEQHPALRVLADSQLMMGENQQAASIIKNLSGEMGEDASLFSRAGYQLLREGDVQQAREIVEQGSELGTTTEQLMQLGVLQLSLNDISGLLKLEQAAEQAPESNLSKRTLASAYLLTEQYDKAQALAQNWMEQQPNEYNPKLLAAELALRDKDLALARDYVEQARALNSESVDTSIAVAQLLIAEEKVEQAVSQLQTTLDSHPNSSRALSLYYVLAANSDAQQDATNRIKMAAANQTNNMQLTLLYARVLFDQRNYDGVKQVFEDSQSDFSKSALYWNLLGQAYLRSNEFDLALQHYQAWYGVAPKNRDAVLGQLLILDLQQKYSDALELVNGFREKGSDQQMSLLAAYFHAVLRQTDESRQILEAVPKELLSLSFVRGILARNEITDGEYLAAVDHAQAAYDANKNTRNMLVLVVALEGSGQREKAFEVIEKQTSASPDDVRVQMMLAERQIQKDVNQAIATYEKANKTRADNFVVLNNLAFLYLQQGQTDKALPLSERAVELQPDMPEAVDTLAQIYIRKNRLDDAKQLYTQIVVNDINNDEVVFNYIELLVTMGDQQLAQRRYEQREWRSQDFKDRAKTLLAGS